MGASGQLSTSTKQDLFTYLGTETDSGEILSDKIRILVMMAGACSDLVTVQQAIELVKHPGENKQEGSADFDDSFLQNMIKQRKDFSQTGQTPLQEEEKGLLSGLIRQATKQGKGLIEKAKNFLGTNKREVQLEYVKKVLSAFMTGTIPTKEQGQDCFYNIQTGKSSPKWPNSDLNQTPVVVFACGGGSHSEYELLVKNLNEQMCANNYTLFAPETTEEVQEVKTPKESVTTKKFKQVIYGTDQVYSPKVFSQVLQKYFTKQSQQN